MKIDDFDKVGGGSRRMATAVATTRDDLDDEHSRSPKSRSNNSRRNRGKRRSKKNSSSSSSNLNGSSPSQSITNVHADDIDHRLLPPPASLLSGEDKDERIAPPLPAPQYQQPNILPPSLMPVITPSSDQHIKTTPVSLFDLFKTQPVENLLANPVITEKENKPSSLVQHHQHQPLMSIDSSSAVNASTKRQQAELKRKVNSFNINSYLI